MKLFHFLALAGAAVASPLEKRAGPSVKIANGTINGGSSGKIEFFKGIPFAQPPVGKLRFKHPLPYDSDFGELNGTNTAPLCVQADGSTGQEDCLKLLVIRPATRPAAKLPVVVFIHGGSFSAGGAEDGNDGTPLVEKGVALGQPFVLVSIQYRLGAFGFLPGKELVGNANLGLRDQRLALEWVRDNIAAFGGDPDKVVIFGFSAGSMSCLDQTLINGGNADGLFRGVILASGSVLPALNVDHPKSQDVYDTLVSRTGCGSSGNTLECLRNLDAKTLQKAAYSLKTEYGHLGINLPYLPRPDPSDSFFSVSPDAALSAGKFSKVPVLSGDTEDEGTLFALTQANITTSAYLSNYIATYFPGYEQEAKTLVSKYPDDLGISGAPYGTGLNGNVFGQFKRLASILGDLAFIFERRFHLQKVCDQVPCYSYLNSALHGFNVLGSFHGSDGMVMLSGASTVPAQTQQRYAISFITTLDPNGDGVSSPLIQFPKYTSANPQLVLEQGFNNELGKDDFRATQYKYWSENVAKFRL
ncbi:Alpha/Beta hydrolase protein [Aspergillus pseudoustus]|uniref:Carboxylic ester hydrolase n=1 Tax=Aspergillus pseudoustus TaxID=1810923 RepID=A0ABR4KFK5_9EURO